MSTLRLRQPYDQSVKALWEEALNTQQIADRLNIPEPEVVRVLGRADRFLPPPLWIRNDAIFAETGRRPD